MELHVDFSKWDPEVQKQYLLNRSAELDVRRGELEVRRAELEIRRLEAEAQIATATAQKANAEARKSVEVFPGIHIDFFK